jgi:hypothetical protein
MQKVSSMMNKLLLVSAGAFCTFVALVPSNELSAQSKFAPNKAHNNKDKVISPASLTSKNSASKITKKTPKQEISNSKGINRSINQAQYLKLDPKNAYKPSIFLAQESSADALRQNLKIAPLDIASSKDLANAPGLTFATPSAFGAYWGDAFLGISGATAGKARAGQVDGSISAGFGLGTSDTVGVEVAFNIGSIKNFAANGSMDIKLHRTVYSEGSNRIAVAAGWNTFAQYGNEGIAPSSVYGVLTTYSLLQPDSDYNKMPISFTVGAGGGSFRKDNASIGVMAGVGVQVHPQIGLGFGWSGVGINAGVSYVPVPSVPLTIGLTGGDLSNTSVGGTVLVLNLSYGFNFLPK